MTVAEMMSDPAVVAELLAAGRRNDEVQLRLQRWDVVDGKRNGRFLFSGTLAECYEKYPTLVSIGLGQMTARGLMLLREPRYV